MRLRGGETDSQTGKHVLGTPFDVKEAYKNSNTFYTKHGALQDKDGDEILLTSRQVFDYLNKRNKKNWKLQLETTVSDIRKTEPFKGKKFHFGSDFKITYENVLVPGQTYLLYVLDPETNNFILKNGNAVEVSDEQAKKDVLLEQKTVYSRYQQDKLFDEVSYYKLVKENEQQILKDLLDPKPNSSYFTYLATLAGVAGAGAGAAGAGAGAGAAAGAAAAAGPALALAAPAAAAGPAALALAAPAAAAGALVPAAAAGALAAAPAAAAGALVAAPAAAAGALLGLFGSVLGVIGIGAAVGAGSVAVYNYWTAKSPKQKLQIIETQTIKVAKAKEAYKEAFELYRDATRAQIAYERLIGENDYANKSQKLFEEEMRHFGEQDELDKEVESERIRIKNVLDEAATKADAEEAARRKAEAVPSRAVPSQAAQAAQAASISNAQAAQAAAIRNAFQAPSQAAKAIAQASAGRAAQTMGQRSDYANRSLERRRLMMMRRRMPSLRQMIRSRTPSPKRRTPSPKRRTPSPKRRTPSPRRRTPSPRRRTPSRSRSRTPSPRRKVTRKRKTPSLKLKRKLAARRR